MGKAYLKMQKYKDAIDTYIRALKIDHNYMKAKNNLEYLLKKKEQDKKKRGAARIRCGDKGSAIRCPSHVATEQWRW